MSITICRCTLAVLQRLFHFNFQKVFSTMDFVIPAHSSLDVILECRTTPQTDPVKIKGYVYVLFIWGAPIRNYSLKSRGE